MPNEGFLRRWSRLKAEPAPAAAVPATAPPAASAFAPDLAAAAPAFAPDARVILAAGAPEVDAPLPTLANAALLDAGSDYSAFIARGVDADVRRLAMKKLFADPHFNVIDGLDIYMADYNVPSPVSAAMLASLSHAKSVFGRIDELIEPAAGEGAPSLAAAFAADDAAPSRAKAAAANEAAPSLTTAAPTNESASSLATAAAANEAAAPLAAAAAANEAAPSLTTAAPANEAPAPPPPDQEVA